MDRQRELKAERESLKKQVTYKLLKKEGHTHTARLNIVGDGSSSTEDGHSHLIRGKKVFPAGKNNHTHPLRKLNEKEEPKLIISKVKGKPKVQKNKNKTKSTKNNKKKKK